MPDEGGLRAPDAPGEQSALDAALEQVREFGGAVLAVAYSLEESAEELVQRARAGGPVPGYELTSRYRLEQRSPMADACRSGRPLWLTGAELAAYPGGATGGEPPDVSLGALPLGAGEQLLGCLVVLDEQGEGFDADRRNLLELYADHATEQLAELPTEQAVVNRALEHGRLGAFTMDQHSGRVQADRRALELLCVAPEVFDGQVETLLASIVPEDLPALMTIVESLPVASGGRELELRVRRAAGELRWLHLRCRVRVDASGAIERVLCVVVDASHLRPTTDAVSRVQRLSATLAGAATVQEVSQVAVAAVRELGADRVAIVAPKGDRRTVTAVYPPKPDDWPPSWHAEWPDAPSGPLPPLEEVLREGRTGVWSRGTAPDGGLTDIGRGGLVVLPLTADGQVSEVCLAGWDEPHTFDTQERCLLIAVAGLVRQALVRARSVDAQHELATMVQRSLLPRTLPTLPGAVAAARYLPATVELEVGGDWYDLISLSDRHVALVIGDVQGHSAGAATIMGQIRTAIRAYAVEGHSPDVVVSHANRLLLGMETDLFATCCYVAMDLEEGDAWIVRAGHLPLLVRDPDGGTRELEVEGGPPLGVVADAEFPMTTVGLAPGSVLTLLTDGLVESSSLPLEDGLLRVREALAAADPSHVGGLADALLGGVNRRDDDVALLLLRYDGMRVKPLRASWTLWRLPDAVGHARRFTGRTLRSWQVSEVDAALLIVSELVTNALVHTQGQVRLDLRLAAGRLRVAVSDASPRTPARPTSVDWEATGGRGILLVEAIATSWGSVPLSGGKQVWAELDVPPTEAQPEGTDDGEGGLQQSFS